MPRAVWAIFSVRAFAALVGLNFVFFFFLAAVGYVNSSFLSTFLESGAVSAAFAVQAVLIMVALFSLPYLIQRVKPKVLVYILVPITAAAVFLMGSTGNMYAVMVGFMVQGIGIYSLMYVLDLFLESVTKDESITGNIRGVFLTTGNAAVFLAPFAIALLVIGSQYSPLYVFAGVMLLLSLIIAGFGLKISVHVFPHGHSFARTLRELWSANRSIAFVLVAYLLLWTFYSWVTIYAPLLLITVGGYSWQVIGLVTAIALLPFLLLQIPLGILADRRYGETEIMAIGFVIIGIATAALSFVPLSSLVVWTAVFFATRVGAAMIEVSTETYFFKQVTEQDSSLVSLFRMMRSLGFIVGPVVAFVFLPITGLQHVFVVFGLLLLIGIPISLSIRDTG